MADPSLAVADEPSGRYLPWAVAAMVFLSVLALAGALAIAKATLNWQGHLAGRLTVEIASLPDAPIEPRVERALKLLAEAPGILSARRLPADDVERLIAPWLGSTGGADLPWPVLIDVVTVDPPPDLAALAARLEAEVPGAHLDDPKHWLEGLLALARLLQMLAAAVVLLTSFILVAMIVAATRAGLAAQAQTIELLHIMGARDRYIAGAFRRFIVRRALVGVGLGTSLSLLAMLALAAVVRPLKFALFPEFSLWPEGFAILLAVPVLALVLAALTAERTVLRQLERMT
jgi:cell division transport system permease protein